MTSLLLLGPPGSGKGSIAQMLINEFGWTLISTGSMLRQAIADKTNLGLAAKSIMDSGQLVPDAIIIEMVVDFISNLSGGIIYDGFPRTIVQAQAMQDKAIALDVVVFLDAGDDALVARMSGRRVHNASGRVYHIVNNPPKVAGLDDMTGEPLTIRSDDQEHIVRERLQVYRQLTEPLVGFYRNMANNGTLSFIEINAEQELAKVFELVQSGLAKYL